MTDRTKLIVIDHFGIRDLGNRSSNFGELPLWTAHGATRYVRFCGWRLLQWFDPSAQIWARAATRNRIEKDEGDEPEYGRPADIRPNHPVDAHEHVFPSVESELIDANPWLSTASPRRRGASTPPNAYVSRCTIFVDQNNDMSFGN